MGVLCWCFSTAYVIVCCVAASEPKDTPFLLELSQRLRQMFGKGTYDALLRCSLQLSDAFRAVIGGLCSHGVLSLSPDGVAHLDALCTHRHVAAAPFTVEHLDAFEAAVQSSW